MKKLLTGLFVLTALVFVANAVFACENVQSTSTDKITCNCSCQEGKECTCAKNGCKCGCQKQSYKDCTCGCQNGEKCICDKNCDCIKNEVSKCDYKLKKFRFFRKNKCNCNKK